MSSRVASSTAQPRRARSRGPLTDAVSADTKCFHASSAVVALAAGHNSTIWLAMQDGGVEVRDAHTGQVQHHFAVAASHHRRSKVWCMLSVYDVINREAQMWMGLSSGAIEVYTETYQLRRQLSKHLAGVYCLAQYRGAVAYAGAADFTITQWRVQDGQLLRVMNGHANYVRCLYAEGNALVSGSDDNTVRVWDVASGVCLQHYSHLHRESGGVSALCRVGTAMWSGDHSGTVAVWRLKDGVALLVCRQLSSRVTSLRKVGARVYAGSWEGRICVFNANDCTVAAYLDDHRGSCVSSLACAVEVNRYFVWSGSADNTVRCWHHDEHQPMTSDREGFLDMRWYYTTQRPYLLANEELLEQHREASELVVLSSGSDAAVREFLDTFGEGRETAAARFWMQDSRLKQSQKACEKAEEETRAMEAAVTRKTPALNLLKDQLARLTEAVATARQNQLALAPPAPGVTVAGAPSVLPAVPGVAPPLPPPPTVPPMQSYLPTSTAAASSPPPAASATLAPGAVLPPSQMVLPPGTTPLPPPPPAAAVPLPPPHSSLVSVLPPVPPPPSAAVPLPPPPETHPASSSSSSARVITETQVTLSRSFEPVLGALPPPPSAAGPKKTFGALLRMGGGSLPPPPPSSSSSGAAAATASVVGPAPPPPMVVVPLPPPPMVAVPARPDGPRTPPDTPLPKPAAPRARRMSF